MVNYEILRYLVIMTTIAKIISRGKMKNEVDQQPWSQEYSANNKYTIHVVFCKCMNRNELAYKIKIYA